MMTKITRNILWLLEAIFFVAMFMSLIVQRKTIQEQQAIINDPHHCVSYVAEACGWDVD